MSAVEATLRGVGARASKSAVRSRAAPLALVLDPLRIALFILTILTISRVHERYPVLAAFRPALLLVMASIGYAYLNPRYLARGNVLRMWPMRLVAALGIQACCSAVFGISLGGSATFILDSYAKTLAYAFLIAVSIRQVRDLYTLVWAYVVSCGILAFLSIFVFEMSKVSGSYVTRLDSLYTYDSNDLGVVMMVGLPLALLLLTVARGAKRWILLVILVGISVTMARSGSRGGFLGFVAAGVAALIMVNGVSGARRFLVLAAAVIALVVGAPPGYWKQMGTILTPEEDYNFTTWDGRKALAERSIDYMTEYPSFGLGIGNFARAECTISPKIALLKINGPIRCVPPHNSYLQAGAEMGVPGFLIWVSLVIGGIVAPLRLRHRLPKSWRSGTESKRFLYNATSFFSVAMIGFAVPSFFVSFAWMDPVYVMAALLTGLYVAAQVQFEEWESSGGGRASRIGSSGAVAGWRVKQSAWRSRIMGEREPFGSMTISWEGVAPKQQSP
jgi:O-antigen ligase